MGLDGTWRGIGATVKKKLKTPQSHVKALKQRLRSPGGASTGAAKVQPSPIMQISEHQVGDLQLAHR